MESPGYTAPTHQYGCAPVSWAGPGYVQLNEESADSRREAELAASAGPPG